MWIARDKDGCLNLYRTKPIRDNETEQWLIGEGSTEVNYLSDEFFKGEITWEDEPLEVDLMLTEIGMSQKYDELKDAYEALHMLYLSQVSLYKSLYEEEKKKTKGYITVKD